MYEELIKKLRSTAKLAEYGLAVPSYYLTEAADAVEELQKENAELLFRCGQAEAMIDHYQAEEGE